MSCLLLPALAISTSPYCDPDDLNRLKKQSEGFFYVARNHFFGGVPLFNGGGRSLGLAPPPPP